MIRAPLITKRRVAPLHICRRVDRYSAEIGCMDWTAGQESCNRRLSNRCVSCIKHFAFRVQLLQYRYVPKRYCLLRKKLFLTDRKTSGQSNLTKRQHRRRTWTVQSYSPGCANVLSWSWTHPSPHTKRHLGWFSCFCRAHDRDIQTDRQTTLLRL